MPKRIAKWNPSRDCWEEPHEPIFGQPDVFSETFPISGMTRNGELSLRPQSEHPTEESEFSSSPGAETPLLRTVSAAEMEGGMVHPERAAERGRQVQLADQMVYMVAPEQLKR